MFRAVKLGLVLTLVALGCSSSSSNVELIPPRFRVREAAGAMRPTRNQVRVPMNLLVDVYNDSAERIVLKRLVIQASPLSRSGIKFEPVTWEGVETVPGKGVRTIDVWITAWVQLPNLDSETQMTVRGVAYFETSFGGFRRMFNLEVLGHTELKEPGRL